MSSYSQKFTSLLGSLIVFGTLALPNVAHLQTIDERTTAGADGRYERAIVQSVKQVTQQNEQGATTLSAYEIQFLSGPEKGTTRTITSDLSSNAYQIDARPGDKILIDVEPNPQGGEPLAFIEGFDRRNAVYMLIALWIISMVLLAGWQGFKTAASIILCVFLIGAVLIPSFLHGISPIPVAMLLATIFTAISTGVSMGWNKKSFVSTVGTMGGVFIAYLIAWIFATWMKSSGLATEEDRLFFEKNPTLNPQGLLFAGIIIAAMGVVEDVAVSIASGIMEVRKANPSLGFQALFRSGMVVGRDHLGALSNTLVFAYVGGSLTSLLLYAQHRDSWAKFINFDVVVDEILRSLAGTIGLIFTVPVTAFLAAWFALRTRPEDI